ncbi:hypothetical protein A8A54_04370 [Brucella pseudogrignonensis]|uniref:hypothetical protein n=1 Tax=Brucella pseudogrignonensis TaxID=419475 RepID=UPI0007DA6ADA|nr:hypothetical protein [Brucella pseudogrignonensis]ANG95786.1 hypothetical protein A8A54_04370 [Brucella pseudogrignonensis]
MAKRTIKDDRPYDSTKDHGDKGDYLIATSVSYNEAEMLDGAKTGGRWSAKVVYKTRTLKIVETGVGDGPMRLKAYKCYPDDPAKDAAQKQKAHDRMLPFLEKFRSYRAVTKKRYEIVREESRREKLPLVPELLENVEKKQG